MKYQSIIFLILINLVYLFSQPTTISYFNWVDGVYGLQTINIQTGAVTTPVELSIPIFYEFQSFLGFDDDGNYIIFTNLLGKSSFILLTLSTEGEIISQSKTVPYISNFVTFGWYSQSVQFDSVNQVVYIGGATNYGEIIEVYDFSSFTSYIVNVTMPHQFANICTFDGVGNYYMINPNFEYNNFTLYNFNVNSKSLSEPIPVTGLAPDSSPYAYYTNDQFYIANFNLSTNYPYMQVLTLDLETGYVTNLFSPAIGVSNNPNYWFYQNYLITLIQSSGNNYVVLYDLNTYQVISKSQLSNSLVPMEMITIIS